MTTAIISLPGLVERDDQGVRVHNKPLGRFKTTPDLPAVAFSQDVVRDVFLRHLDAVVAKKAVSNHCLAARQKLLLREGNLNQPPQPRHRVLDTLLCRFCPKDELAWTSY